MGDAYGTGIVEKMSQAELADSGKQKRLSAIATPSKKENEDV